MCLRCVARPPARLAHSSPRGLILEWISHLLPRLTSVVSSEKLGFVQPSSKLEAGSTKFFPPPSSRTSTFELNVSWRPQPSRSTTSSHAFSIFDTEETRRTCRDHTRRPGRSRRRPRTAEGRDTTARCSAKVLHRVLIWRGMRKRGSRGKEL